MGAKTICGFGFLLIGLLVVVGFLWAVMRNLRNGRVWAGKLGFIDRSENPFGFWSAIFANALYCVAALAVLWLAAPRVCGT
jgi:hypothetical protein